VFGPDATIALDFALNRMAGLIEKWTIYPEAMQANLDRLGGLVHSQRVLLALTQAGMPREDAYRMVQANAMEIWKAGGGDFAARLKADPAVKKRLSAKQIDALFDLGYHTKHVDTIFRRVFGGAKKKAKKR